MDTLVGHAEDELVRLTMECGGTSHTHRNASTLRMRLESGELVRLDVSQAQLVPNVDAHDDFGTLLEQGLATPFLGDAPADHVSVHITGLRIGPGMPIAVAGKVEHTMAGEGYQDASIARPTSMYVHVLAAGADAAQAVASAVDEARAQARRPSPKPASAPARAKRPRRDKDLRPSLWWLLVPGVPAAVLAAIAIAGSLGGDRSQVYTAGAVAVAWASITIFVAARRRFPPDLRTQDEDRSGKGIRTMLSKGVALPLGLGMSGLVVIAGIASQTPVIGAETAVLLGGVGVLALFQLGYHAISEARSLRRLWLVATASPPKAIGRTGALDGRVRSGRVARTRKHEKHRDEWRDGDGKAHVNVWFTYEDVVHLDTLEIELDDGRRLVVHPHDGAVAAEESRQSGLQLAEEIGPGDRVRVVARPAETDDGLEVRSTGRDSMFLLASRRRSARAAARRALALHAAALASLVAIAAAALVLALAVS